MSDQIWPGVSEAEINAGARALRERQQAGRITREWDALPRSEQRKWREHALCVLISAARAAKRIP